MVNKKSKKLVLKNVNLIDSIKNYIQRDMVIIIKNGIIEDVGKFGEVGIPKEARILTLSGKTVIPGLIDSHVHLFQSGVNDFMKPYAERLINKFKRNCLITIRSGVTTVRNMPGSQGYSIFKFRKKVNQGEIVGPRILASGPAVTVPYGYFSILSYMPFNSILRFFLTPLFRIRGLSIDVNNAQEARNVVKKLKREEIDFIKTITPGSNYPFAEDENFKLELIEKGLKEEQIDATMKPEILQGIVEEANNLGLKVACHNIYGPDGFKEAVAAGVDSIEHTPIGLVDEKTFSLMKEKEVYWVPTIYTSFHWKSIIDNPELYETAEMKELIPEPLYSFGKKSLQQVRKNIEDGGIWCKFYQEMIPLKEKYFPENLKLAQEKGVKIAAAVDCGAGGAGYVPHGQLYKELEVYVDNDMSEFDALQTATKNAAELLGIEDEVGTIEKGKAGDIVVLESNPLENISNLKNISLVIKEGNIVYSKDENRF